MRKKSKILKQEMSNVEMRPLNILPVNSADVSPGVEMAPKSSFSMIRSGHGNPKTSSLCLQVHVYFIFKMSFALLRSFSAVSTTSSAPLSENLRP